MRDYWAGWKTNSGCFPFSHFFFRCRQISRLFGFPASWNKHYKNDWSIQKVAAAASPCRFLHIWWIFYSQIYFVDCALMWILKTSCYYQYITLLLQENTQTIKFKMIVYDLKSILCIPPVHLLHKSSPCAWSCFFCKKLKVWCSVIEIEWLLRYVE